MFFGTKFSIKSVTKYAEKKNKICLNVIIELGFCVIKCMGGSNFAFFLKKNSQFTIYISL